MVFDRMAGFDYRQARRKSFFNKVESLLTGKSADLLPLDEVRKLLPIRGQRELGAQPVPLDKIVGSEGRYRDFDRAFLPRREHTRSRWVSIDVAHYQDVPLPPVELTKIGDVYFVRDGNHRVSVARERGQEFIDAYVTELETPVPITAESDMADVRREQEYSLFLEQSQIERLRPDANIRLTLPGGYATLLEHIAVHRWYLGEREGREVPYEEAVASWCENVYTPLVRIIREHDIVNEFPRRTEADLYLWIIEHQWYLREAYGDIPMEEAADRFADERSERLLHKARNALRRLFRRLRSRRPEAGEPR